MEFRCDTYRKSGGRYQIFSSADSKGNLYILSPPIQVFSRPLFFADFHRIYIRVFVPKSNGNCLCKGIDPARDSVRFWCISPAIAQRSKLLLRFRSHRHSAYFYGRCAVSQPFQAASARFLFSGRSWRFGEPCRDSIVKAKKPLHRQHKKREGISPSRTVHAELCNGFV